MTLSPLEGAVALNFEAGQIKLQQTKHRGMVDEREGKGSGRENSLTSGYNKFDFVNLFSQISQLLFFLPKKLTQV